MHDLARAFQQPAKRRRREVRNVLVEKIREPIRFEYAVDARAFDEQPARLCGLSRAPCELFDERRRIGKVFEHVTDHHGVGLDLAHVGQRLEQARVELDARTRLGTCVGIKAQESPAEPVGCGQSTNEVTLAATDFYNRRTGGQALEQGLRAVREVVLPQQSLVEHAIGIALVGNVLVAERAIPHVRAGRALHEVVRAPRHRPRGLGRCRPAERRKRLAPAVEEGRSHPASHTGQCASTTEGCAVRCASCGGHGVADVHFCNSFGSSRSSRLTHPPAPTFGAHPSVARAFAMSGCLPRRVVRRQRPVLDLASRARSAEAPSPPVRGS